MAVSKSELLQFVAQYQQDNKRPCPKSAVVATHGESALDILKELVADSSIGCRRGRNGGYYPTDTVASLSGEDAPIEAENASPSDENVENESNDLAEQFAALEAKLARLSESESDDVLSE